MQDYRADLHIHTVLSPCADLDMSPEVIVAKAKERQLQIIGITDHNSTLNCKAVAECAGKEGIVVIPGCEVNTSEEIHVLTFFADYEALDLFQQYIDEHLAVVENDLELFGFQVIVDSDSNILGYENRYLGAALDVGIEELSVKVYELGGIFIPAHIDRPVNSLFSQLGFLPESLECDAFQISKKFDVQQLRKSFVLPGNACIVKFSDAHYPENVGEVFTIFSMNAPSIEELRKALRKEDARNVFIPDKFSE